MSDAHEQLDDRLMLRALREGQRGDPSPNPHVGALVAQGSEVISVGHHARCGGPHAEVVALRRAGERARGGTLYVTFEPCNHYGRTPPCTEAIVASGVRRVVVGCEDPAPHVPGSSAKLRAAGLQVVLGVRREQARRLIADFETFMLRHRPFVTLKAAVTLDGRIATRTGDSRWITGQHARTQMHRLRAKSDAVLVGIGTVLADDPELTVRHARGRNPLRAVLDSRLRTPKDSKLVRGARRTPTIIFHGPEVAPAGARARALAVAGVELVRVRASKTGRGIDLRAVLRELAKREVVRLLVEGGAHVHGAFLASGLADRAVICVAPRILGDERALPLAIGLQTRRMSASFVLRTPEVRRHGDDVVLSGDLSRRR